MDEILSSIRQIIADDDEAAAQKMPAPRAVAPRPIEAVPTTLRPVPQAEAPATMAEIDPFGDDDEDEIAPLALSPEQIVEEEAEVTHEAAEDLSALLDAPADLVVPDDVAFEQDREDEPAPAMVAPQPEPGPAPERDKPLERPSFVQAAPMPDPDLSRDLAEELLEPATSAAVRSAMSKLNTPKLTQDLALGANGLTIEAMIREMLRPMLKEWLDENLPSMVERIVAQEIERVSRGG